MCCAIPYPWFALRLSVWRINISRVPGRKLGSVDRIIPIDSRWEGYSLSRYPVKTGDLTQEERRNIFEKKSHHIAEGVKSLLSVARQLYHSRDIGEPFDFLTWFEYAPEHSEEFEQLSLAGRLLLG